MHCVSSYPTSNDKITSKIEIITNSAPKPGSFMVFNSDSNALDSKKGIAAITLWNFRTSYWQEIDDDIILYKFGYIQIC